MPTIQQQIIQAYRTGRIKDEKDLQFFLMMEELKKLHLSQDLEDKINKLLGQITLIQGKDGRTPTDFELLRLIKPLIPKAKDGKDGKTHQTS